MRSGLAVFVSVLFLTGSSAAWAQTEKQFRAGAAVANISPGMGLSIEGNMHDHKVSSIHDELHARCVVLDDGEHRLAIVIADSCMIPRSVYDEAKTIINDGIQLPVENMLMAATHTHSAPAAVGIFQSTADPEYQKLLARRLADAVLQAIKQLEPAEIGWGSGNEPRHVSNRRWKMKPGAVSKNLVTGANESVRMNPPPGSADLIDPAGPTDPEVSVLAVRARGGRPIALLANYSMHYCGGVGGEGVVSADYFGAFCERVESSLSDEKKQPRVVALLSNGTSGDCNSIDFRTASKPEAPFVRIQRVANDVADVALGVYKSLKFREWVPLRTATQEIMLKVRLPSSTEVERASAQLAKAERRNGQLIPWSSDIYARETVLLGEFPREVPVLLQVLRIGDLGIAAIPCEVFAEIGLELKRKSPFQKTFTIELANGYNGYLPTPGQHALGGYETWRARSSYLATDASMMIVTTVLELFAQIKAQAPAK